MTEEQRKIFELLAEKHANKMRVIKGVLHKDSRDDFKTGAETAWPMAEAAGIRKIITALRREATLFGTGTAHNAQDVADWLESKFAAELEGK